MPRETEGKYRQLIEDINDGFVVLRKDRVVFANSKAAEIFGCPLEKLSEESFVKFVAPERLQDTIQSIYERSMRDEGAPEQQGHHREEEGGGGAAEADA